MKRYVSQNKKGDCEASESVVKMFKTDKGSYLVRIFGNSRYSIHNILDLVEHSHVVLGQELHQLLKAHGSFEAVECHLQKWQSEEQKDQLAGGWHSEISLAQMGWDAFHVYSSFE